MALWVPLATPIAGDVPTRVFEAWTFGYPAMFASGLVNIAFPIAVFLRLAGSFAGFQRLRIIVLLMIPCSWLALIYLRFRPREGHVLWILGIVMTLFAEEIAALLQRHRHPKALADA